MDLKLHTATMEGNYDDLIKRVNLFNDARTPNGNTVLHVAAQFRHLRCVRFILEKCPDLLHQVNSKAETALHIAARKDHNYGMVKALIDCAKKVVDPESAGGTNSTGGLLYQMLRAVNEDGDTALHLAARYPRNDGVLELLTEADPEFQHPPNKAQETPLFLACETGTVLDLQAILINCRSPAYSGPGRKTALHAAVASNAPAEMVQALLRRWSNLVREPDENGWTPLHHATRANNIAAVSNILEHDRTVAYIRANNDDHSTALHIAAAQKFIKVMEKILWYCSDCWEVVNGKGQNIFHIAVEMESNTLLEFLKKKIWSKYLLNQKDTKGNTPLHLLASSTLITPFFLQILLKEGDWGVLNHKNLTPLDIALSNDVWFVALLNAQVQRQSEKKKVETLKALVGRGASSSIIDPPKDRPIYIPGWRNVVNDDRGRMKKLKENEKMNEKAQVERFREMANAHLIVATLIATVTFAAAFTLPGGYYDSAGGKNQGTAILLKKATFKVFIISNTIAVASSTASVFLHIAASLYDDKEDLLPRYRKAFYLILIAIIAMVLAFVTGIYVVLAPSLTLAIATCVTGSSISFVIFLRELVKMDFFSKSRFLMTDFFNKSRFLMTASFNKWWFLMTVFFIKSWILMTDFFFLMMAIFGSMWSVMMGFFSNSWIQMKQKLAKC